MGVLFSVLELSDLVILSSNITQFFFRDPDGGFFHKNIFVDFVLD